MSETFQNFSAIFLHSLNPPFLYSLLQGQIFLLYFLYLVDVLSILTGCLNQTQIYLESMYYISTTLCASVQTFFCLYIPKQFTVKLQTVAHLVQQHNQGLSGCEIEVLFTVTFWGESGFLQQWYSLVYCLRLYGI